MLNFLEGKKTVTGTYYIEVLRKLKAKLAEKCPEKLHCGILFIMTMSQHILLRS